MTAPEEKAEVVITITKGDEVFEWVFSDVTDEELRRSLVHPDGSMTRDRTFGDVGPFRVGFTLKAERFKVTRRPR